MNNTFSLKQISKTRNIDANLIIREVKSDLMSRFLEIKSINPKLRRKQLAKGLVYSHSQKKTL